MTAWAYTGDGPPSAASWYYVALIGERRVRSASWTGREWLGLEPAELARLYAYRPLAGLAPELLPPLPSPTGQPRRRRHQGTHPQDPEPIASAPTEPGAYTISQFCEAHGLNRMQFYKVLVTQGRAPQVTSIGRHRIITREAAAEWRARPDRGGDRLS